ncbi:MAG: sterol desaturase family protein [Bdellovibrionales bacterium]
MIDNWLRTEILTRLIFFFGVFTLIAGWEIYSPRRRPTFTRRIRWPANLSLVFMNQGLLRLLLPFTAIAAAEKAQSAGWGLFHSVDIPAEAELILSILVLDLVIYLQHVVFHKVPLLWRLHRMHHADLDYDVTTGSRFHPIEILISMLIKIGAVLLLGASPLSVLCFEILLNATAMFNHGNISMAPGLDKLLRLFVVTPDMHRIHHSIVVKETNSNFGFNWPWWDRLFGTYLAAPSETQETLTIGLPIFRDPKYLSLGRLLKIPFEKI